MATALALGLAVAGLSAAHATDAGAAYPTFSSAFNNIGIATEANPGVANLDGAGDSLSADALNSAGWKPGARVTVSGTTYTLPDVPPGQPDNIVAGGQHVPVSGSGNALGFLLTATGGPVTGTGTVHYSDGTTSSYTLDRVGDWKGGNSVAAAVLLDRSAKAPTGPVKLFAVTVSITRGKSVASVTLPSTPEGSKRLHIFSLAVRSTPVAPDGAAWTGSWSTAYSDAPSTSMGSAFPNWSNQTFRMVVNPHTSGTTIRLRFANTFSTEPVELGHVTAANQADGATAGQTPATVTFGGRRQATLPAGGEIVSDPVTLPVTAGKNLLISYHLPGTVRAAPRHSYALSTSYTTARLAGDRSADVGSAAFTQPVSFWSLVSGVDVATSGSGGTVVAIGDSQTDGAHSTKDTNRRWPDYYASFLGNGSSTPGVLNAGISANRIAKDYATGSGPSAVTRLDRDVFAQPSVREVVLYEGINDIVHDNAPATAITDAIQEIASQARARGIRVTVATIPGSSGYPSHNGRFRLHEAVRQSVNAYIRTTGDIDDYIDFDVVTKDLDDPYAVRPSLVSTDKLHFNDSGTELLGRTLADRVPRASLPMGETTTGDFNGDSVSDLLARHDPTGTLRIWFARGDGTFTAAKELTGGWQNYSQTIAGDFTNDGKADIMARYEGPSNEDISQNTLRLWVNRGDGTFHAARNVTGGWNFTQTAAADFDGNGKTDLIARDAEGNLKIWAGRGDGTFGAAQQLSTNWKYTQTTAADFNGDGEADIIARDPATNTLKMWTHNSAGYFNAARNVTGGWSFSQTVAGDIDANGTTDILARDNATGRLKAWSGRGDTTFGAARDITGGW
ncbi:MULTISPECIES: FG-GAP-like repeat-containing protein [Streptomyces]|uniref:FG-GAP-like repeat-containing protein n=1 Tax=Streptomyces TaxID=1883 RepID=UPI001444DDE7|nr:FG-GAP-like repeat-containing protein [Streptomyces sp. LRa12]WTC50384.1 FG-GAP-like repeat-containing protein [Streptomyces anthocyanicus]